MLATAIEHSATRRPSPGTGCGFFCMYSRVLIVKIPILFGPGWQSVRLWDFRRCDALPGFSAGRGGGGRIRAELDPDDFPLFLGFWGSEDKWKGYDNVGGGGRSGR